MPTQSPKRTLPKVKRDSVVNLRLPVADRAIIDNAAFRLGKTRTDFIVESARQHAVDVLLEQRLFSLDEKQMRGFLAALDKPPAPNARLKRLMDSAPLWEK